MTHKPLPDLIVTRDGVPIPDQAAGVQQFKAACQRAQKPSLYCFGRCDGMGDLDRDGSYVKIVYRVPSSSGYQGSENHIKLSEGEAELLSAELQGALAQRSRPIVTGGPRECRKCGKYIHLDETCLVADDSSWREHLNCPQKCKRHVWSFDHSANEIRCTTPGCEAVR